MTRMTGNHSFRLPEREWDALSSDAKELGLSTSDLLRFCLAYMSKNGRMRSMLRNYAEIRGAEEKINEVFAKRALVRRAGSIVFQASSGKDYDLPYEDAIVALRACAVIARNSKWTREHRLILDKLNRFRLRPLRHGVKKQV